MYLVRSSWISGNFYDVDLKLVDDGDGALFYFGLRPPGKLFSRQVTVASFPYYIFPVARWSVLLLYEAVRFLAMSVILTILVLSEWKDKQV